MKRSTVDHRAAPTHLRRKKAQMKALRTLQVAAVLPLFTLIAGCSGDPAGPDPEEPPPLQASTWLVTSNDFAFRGITDFRLTFDPNNDDVTRIQYKFNGTMYDYDAAEITGAGAAVGTSVDVNVEWKNGDNSFEFDGILTSSRDQAAGTIVYWIAEGGDREGGAGSATMTKGDSTAPGNQAPVATIDNPGQDTTVTLGDAVDFGGTASDADGMVVSHMWDFGDGNGAAVEDPGSHTYSTAGTFIVRYAVTDDDGATSASAAVAITVVDPPPIQNSTWSVESNGLASSGISNFLMTFDANSTDVTRIRYTYNGTAYDYGAAQIIGAGGAVGASVDVKVLWDGDSTFEFDGIMTSTRNLAVGTIEFTIVEGIDVAEGVGGATMTRQ
jgi:PKD repeat protein